jgi:hypothetical protein
MSLQSQSKHAISFLSRRLRKWSCQPVCLFNCRSALKLKANPFKRQSLRERERMRVSSLHVLILARRLVPTIEGCHPAEEEVLRVCVCSNCEQQQQWEHTCVRLLSAPTPVRLCSRRYIYLLAGNAAGRCISWWLASLIAFRVKRERKTHSWKERRAFLFVRVELSPLWSKIGRAANVTAGNFFYS